MARANKSVSSPTCVCQECDWISDARIATTLAQRHVAETGHRVKCRQIITWDYLPAAAGQL